MATGALRILAPAPRTLTSRRRKGEIIFQEGDEARGTYEIQEGWVRLQILTEEGERQVLGFLTRGDSFGFNTDAYSLTAEAVTDVKMVRSPISSASDPDAAFTARDPRLIQMALRFDQLAHRAQQLAFRSIEERVLCFLAWLAHRQGAEPESGMVRIPMRRQDIADYLGIAAETLSRTMTQLQDEGRIVLRGPRLFAVRRPPHFASCRAAGAICGACHPVPVSRS